nr:vacuolar protein sorting-associated protein 32 homolog 2-like [Tanacetum cinerariifolium]
MDLYEVGFLGCDFDLDSSKAGKTMNSDEALFIGRKRDSGCVMNGSLGFNSFGPSSYIVDEPASLVRDVSEGEACPTDYGFIADQDRATIAKSSSLPYDSAPRVTSLVAAEGSMQPNITELTALCTSLQRQYSELLDKFQAQEVEICKLKDRVKVLEDREGVAATQSGDDAPIKERTTVLAGGIDVPTGSGFIPTAGPHVGDIPTGSDDVPTTSLVFATATVVTPYSRRNGKEVMVESDTPKKQSLDRTNETIAKYIQEYQEFASELPLERRIELISDLVKYQGNYAKTYKFQSQRRKPRTKKQKKDFYMVVIKSNLGWKVKDFKGMTFEEIKAKFNMIWKQVEDFIPMGSKEEAERYKRKGIRFDQESSKKLKSSEEVIKDVKSTEEIPEEKIKEMMQLAPIEEVEDLNQLWALVKEYLSIRPATKWKLYDLCGVHQVTAKDKNIFMLVEKDYPLRKGLAIMMISYKLQVETYSRMANELVLKIYKIAILLKLDLVNYVIVIMHDELEPEELERAELEEQLLHPSVMPTCVPSGRQSTRPVPRKNTAEEDELAELQAEMAL